MSSIHKQFRRRPRLSMSLALSMAALLALTLIPFKYDKTIGYQVAVAGVDKDIALDGTKMSEMLVKLGYGDAAIDVTNCAATCYVIISKLASADDANIVMAAFDKLNDKFTCKIELLLEPTTGNFISAARGHVLRFGDESKAQSSDERFHNIIIERLGENGTSFAIKLNPGDANEYQLVEFIPNQAKSTEEGLHWIAKEGVSELFELSRNRINEIVVDLDLTSLSDEDIRSLEANGLEVGRSTDENGEEHVFLSLDNESLTCKIGGLQFCTIGDSSNKTAVFNNDHVCASDKGCAFFSIRGGTDFLKGGPLSKIHEIVGEIDLANLSADDIRNLESAGLKVEVSVNDSGEKIIALTLDDGSNVRFGSDDDPAPAAPEDLPESFVLSQNYPNPFNPTTQIDFELPVASHVRLEVYNIKGQKVITLVDGFRSAGQHTVTWNSTSESGQLVASGTYFYRLTAGNQVQNKKMTLIK